ncbi:hypothetical protein BDC45DRAFT_162775 [Circinella umbellata]|nr:hypothetical protein BDC45DRAFT_162775 [Circinella umbellata]
MVQKRTGYILIIDNNNIISIRNNVKKEEALLLNIKNHAWSLNSRYIKNANVVYIVFPCCTGGYKEYKKTLHSDTEIKNILPMLLKSLPPEIVDVILRYLPFPDRWVFSRICRDWRILMLNHPAMWEQLSTYDYDKAYSNDACDGTRFIKGLLPYKEYVKRTFVKHIKITVGNGTHVLSVINFLVADLKCSAITKIDLCVLVVKESCFSQLTSRWGSMLTSLSLVFRSHDTGNEQYFVSPAPDMILRECPNLEKLYYIGSIHNIRRWKPSFESKDFQHQRLRDLVLIIPNSRGHFEIKDLLVVLPNVEQLELDLQSIEHSASSFMDILHHHCTRVSTLVLFVCYPYTNKLQLITLAKKRRSLLQKMTTAAAMATGTSTAMINDYSNNIKNLSMSTKKSRLKHLIVNDINDEFYKPTTRYLFSMLIEKYHKSLRVLNIESTKLLRYRGELLSSFQFPYLQHVSLSGNCYYFEDNGNDGENEDDSNDENRDDDSEEEEERSIIIKNTSSSPPIITLHGLSRFLSYSIPNLSYLAVSGLKEMNIHLESLIMLTSSGDGPLRKKPLQELHLKNCNAIGSYQFETLFKSIIADDGNNKRFSSAQRQKLTKLSLDNVTNITPKVLSSIGSSKLGCYLEELTLKYCSNVTIEDIDQYLLDNLILARSTTTITSQDKVPMIPKLDIYLRYSDGTGAKFPSKDKIEITLGKINLIAKRWHFSLINEEGSTLTAEQYSDVSYYKK